MRTTIFFIIFLIMTTYSAFSVANTCNHTTISFVNYSTEDLEIIQHTYSKKVNVTSPTGNKIAAYGGTLTLDLAAQFPIPMDLIGEIQIGNPKNYLTLFVKYYLISSGLTQHDCIVDGEKTSAEAFEKGIYTHISYQSGKPAHVQVSINKPDTIVTQQTLHLQQPFHNS